MKFCAVDVETTGAVPQFKSAALWSDETKLYTTSHREFLDAMRAHGRKRYIFVAHNAEYDGNVLLWNAGEDFSIHYINDTYDCGYWQWGNERQRSQLWDTVRLAAGLPLAVIGEAMGMPKYPTPKSLLGEDDWRQSWVCDEHSKRECLECYNLRDAEITWSFVNMLREWLESNLVTMRKSLPGNAVELWKQWDRDQQKSIRSPMVRDLARLAFHGARNEVFKYGRVGYVNTYDRRSHYGEILASMELPDTSTLRYADSDVDYASAINGEGVIEATVWVEPQHIPPLPAVHDNRLYFPVGTFRGAWPIRELRHALPYGTTVLDVHRAAWTHTMCRPFAITAPALLEAREKARATGDPREMIYKFLINAVIGRLGMRDVQTRRIYRRWRPGISPRERIGYDLESSSNYVYMVKEIEHVKPSRTSNIVWAANILGEGRVRLLQRLLLAGTHAVYCDTDSVHSTTAMPVGAGGPGDWISTGDWDSSLYLGAKLYRLDNQAGESTSRAKGIPRHAAESYLSSGKAVFSESLSVREAIQRGMPSGTWVEAHRTMGHAPGTRTIHDPSVLKDKQGYSPTSPVVFASDYVGGVTITNDINPSP